MSARKSVVYWLLDAEGQPLYIGMTDNLRRRMSQHATERYWWPDVASVAHTDEMTRREAGITELSDIQSHWPRHNLYPQRPVWFTLWAPESERVA